MIPKDPAMLLSFINLKLRDQYSSLKAMADDLDLSEIMNKLECAGIIYDEANNQLKFK